MRASGCFFVCFLGLTILAVDVASARRSIADDAIFPGALDVVVRGLNQARPIVQTIQSSQKALTEKQIDAIGVVGLLKDGVSAEHIVRGIDLQPASIRDPIPVRAPQWLSDSYPAASALAKIGPRGVPAVIRAAAEDASPTATRSKLYAEVVVRCLEGDLEIAVMFVERHRRNFAPEPAEQTRLDKLVREIKVVQGPSTEIAFPKSDESHKTDKTGKTDKSKVPGK